LEPRLSRWGEHTDIHQFSLICDLLGSPPESVLKTIASENVRRHQGLGRGRGPHAQTGSPARSE